MIGTYSILYGNHIHKRRIMSLDLMRKTGNWIQINFHIPCFGNIV